QPERVLGGTRSGAEGRVLRLVDPGFESGPVVGRSVHAADGLHMDAELPEAAVAETVEPGLREAGGTVDQLAVHRPLTVTFEDEDGTIQRRHFGELGVEPTVREGSNQIFGELLSLDPGAGLVGDDENVAPVEFRGRGCGTEGADRGRFSRGDEQPTPPHSAAPSASSPDSWS